MEEKKEEKPKEVKDEWIVADIPDTMKPAIVNPKTQKVHTIETALAQILNNMDDLKKLL